MGQGKGLEKGVHVLFLLYTAWFLIEMISYFVLLFDHLSIIPHISFLMISLNYSFFSFHIFSAVMIVPILIHCIRRTFNTPNEKITWVLVIIFFGTFGLPLIIYYWLEIKKEDNEMITAES